jgi:hypothetical protein
MNIIILIIISAEKIQNVVITIAIVYIVHMIRHNPCSPSLFNHPLFSLNILERIINDEIATPKEIYDKSFNINPHLFDNC